MLKINYNNIVIDKQYLTPSQTKQQPNINFNFEPNTYYTLIMYDPDTLMGDYMHWIIMNIKGNINNGDTLFPYKGPSPPINTGIHRYIFFIFKQNTIINKLNISVKERNIKLSILLNKLQLKSQPLSEIYFTSKYQSAGYKKKFHNKLKINRKTKNIKKIKNKKNRSKKTSKNI